MSIRLCAFDMDGVILDSMPTLTQYAVETMRVIYKCPREFAERRYKETTGRPFVQQLDEIFPKDERNSDALRLYETIHAAISPALPLSPMVPMVINTLRELEISTALITSTHKSILFDQLHQVQSLGFDFMGGFQDGFTKVDLLNEAMELMAIFPDECILFGDTEHDRKVAKAANTKFCFIRKPEDLAFYVGMSLTRNI